MHNERYSILYSSATGMFPRSAPRQFVQIRAVGGRLRSGLVGFWTDKGNADADTLALGH